MMVRFGPPQQMRLFIFALSCTLIFAPLRAQIPTKTPPTPVPTPVRALDEGLETRSNWHEAIQSGTLTVGMLFNEVPFGWLDIRGNVTGYDADILRSITALWGIDIRFLHVTRQTGGEMLHAGEVDLLAGGQLLLSQRLEEYAFSHAYHLDTLQTLVRADAPWQTLADLTGQSVGVVRVSAEEDYLAEWSQRENIAYLTRPQPTLDRGLRTLLAGEIEALVGERSQLEQLQREPGQIRPLESVLGALPLAFALPAADSILRDALNHALQTIASNGRLRELHTLYFPSIPHDEEQIPQWVDLGDDGAFNPPDTIAYPEHFTLPSLREASVLRAVLVNTPDSRLANLCTGLATALGELWGLTVDFETAEAASAIASVVAGEADIAIGVAPSWAESARVDFTAPFLRHGSLLLTRAARDITSFANLPSPATIAIPAQDPLILARLREVAEASGIELGDTRVVSAALLANELLADEEVDAIFADSLVLAPFLRDYPDRFRVASNANGGIWFSREYLSIATPENDVAFRNLVELSLQALAQDGRLTMLLEPLTNPDLPNMGHRISQWPDKKVSLQIGSGRG